MRESFGLLFFIGVVMLLVMLFTNLSKCSHESLEREVTPGYNCDPDSEIVVQDGHTFCKCPPEPAASVK